MNFKTCILFFLLSLFGFSQAKEDAIFEDNEGLKIPVYNDTKISPVSKTFLPNFKDNYQDDAFIYDENHNEIERSAWDRFWKSVWDLISRLFDSGSKSTTINALQVIFKILAFLIIAFVIYMIVRIIINKEGGWIFSKTKKNITVSELVEENIHSIDFKAIIETSKKENNYRLTIRYYYLWYLKNLSDREIIEWDIDKTNSDYSYDIQNKNIKEQFNYLSYLYDYMWYGEFELSEENFKKAEIAFHNAIENI